MQVAWIKADAKAILAIHEHVITNSDRLSVTHNDFNTWTLVIRNVQMADRGSYMCQVNTDPMKMQVISINIWFFTTVYLFLLMGNIFLFQNLDGISWSGHTTRYSLRRNFWWYDGTRRKFSKISLQVIEFYMLYNNLYAINILLFLFYNLSLNK